MSKFKTIFQNEKSFFIVLSKYLTISDSFCKLKWFRKLLVEIAEQFFVLS